MKIIAPCLDPVAPARPHTASAPGARPGRTQPYVLLLFACCLLAACGKEPAPVLHPAAAEKSTKMPVPPMMPNTPAAVQAGKTLYVKMNCAGCHTYTGKGWMGPDLTDAYWRYGGAPEDIYRSIYEGRAQGMPAWGKKLPSDEIWELVHYIGSLPTHPGGDPTTVSPVTGTDFSIDKLPPSHVPEPPK